MNRIKAYLLLIVAFVLLGEASFAWASDFELKGLRPGMKLDSLRKLMPQLKCKEWMNGIYAQTCEDQKPSGQLATLADQRLVSIKVIADDDNIAHIINFNISCGIQVAQLLVSLENKWGPPKYYDKVNEGAKWSGKHGDAMQLWKGNGKDNVCSYISIEDAQAVESRKPKMPVPSKDL